MKRGGCAEGHAVWEGAGFFNLGVSVHWVGGRGERDTLRVCSPADSTLLMMFALGKIRLKLIIIFFSPFSSSAQGKLICASDNMICTDQIIYTHSTCRPFHLCHIEFLSLFVNSCSFINASCLKC